ncbi:MAG: phosphatidic acid phosphatase [Firmicutes bacterium]|nr:phosphatidic acid phosphatase [Bacillota bacterium]
MKDDRLRSVLLVLCALLYNFLVYYSGRWLARDHNHFDFTTPADDLIPLLPWTILIYWGCYFFWAINYYLSIRFDKGGRFRFITAHFIGETVILLAFVFLPTSMMRPEISGTGVFNRMLQFTYKLDHPDNLLPSIHCFASWLSWCGVRGNPKIPSWYQTLSLIIAAAICISTMTVKQHVIADVAAGILLGEISYLVSCAGERCVAHRGPRIR